MNALSFKTNVTHPIHRLPFIGGKARDGLGLSFWDVPAAGGYAGGNITGAALAWLWLKHIEKNGDKGPAFVLSKAFNDLVDIQDPSKRGQAAGFLCVIEMVITKLIADGGIHFNQDENELLAKANAGLVYVHEESGDETD